MECQLPKLSVLFVVLPYLVTRPDATTTKTKSYLAFPYGVLSMATYIKKNAQRNIEVNVLDLNLYHPSKAEEFLLAKLKSSNWDVVGFSLMFDQSYSYLDKFFKLVKEANPNILTLLGGASATMSWDLILGEQPFLDAICYSEGEKAMLDLVNAPNFSCELAKDPWVTRAKIKQQFLPPQPVHVDNLNDVINLDYELCETHRYSMKEAFSPFAFYREEKNVKQFFMVTSRGCPFKCTFCIEPALHGGTMRYADVDKIIEHIDYLVHSYGMNVLTIYDDQLLLNASRAKELFRRLVPYKLRIEMPNGVTLVFIDDEMAHLMRQAGVDTIPLAIESGSDYVLRNIINKPLRLPRVKPVVEVLHNNNIFVQAFMVVGMPGETDKDRQLTVDLIKETGIDWAGFSLATPLRGSKLYKLCQEKGYIDKNLRIGDLKFNQYVINAPELGLTQEYITRKAYLMNLDVNFVNNRRMKIKDYNTAIRCFEDVINRYENHAFAHYFLAQAYKATGANEELISLNMDRYQKIVSSDPVWQDYCNYFSLV